MELVNQMKLSAEIIRNSNQKIIPIFPLKKSERAQSNKARRLLLAFLLDHRDAQREYMEEGSPKKARELLESIANLAGYTLHEVNPDEY